MNMTVFIALMMEAESTSKASANFYQTTQRSISEDRQLHVNGISGL
jgi:hypothetical protein